MFVSSTTIEQAMVRRTNSFNVNMRVKLGRWASAPTQRSQRKLFSALIKPHFPPSSLKPKYQGQKSLDGGLQIGHSRAHNRLLLLYLLYIVIINISGGNRFFIKDLLPPEEKETIMEMMKGRWRGRRFFLLFIILSMSLLPHVFF